MTEKEIKEIKEILDFEIPFDKLEEIFDNVEINLNKYIKNDGIKFKRKVQIKYRTPLNVNYKFQNNAYAGKIIGRNDTYEIYVCPLLIKDLFKYSHVVAGYNCFKIKNEEKYRQIFAYHLMYFWLYFITLHEYSHIVLGHADYKTSTNNTISEYIDLSCLSSDEKIEAQAMELEADSNASGLFFASLILVNEKIKEELEYNIEKKDLAFSYLLGIYFLFDFFDLSHKNKPKVLTHPLGIERSLFFAGSIRTNAQELSKILKVDKNMIENIAESSILAFFDYLNISKKMHQSEFMAFLAKINLMDKKKIRERYKKYRLL
jgi:hypothetical protein